MTRAMTSQSAPLSAEVAYYLASCAAHARPDQADQIRATPAGAAAARSQEAARAAYEQLPNGGDRENP